MEGNLSLKIDQASPIVGRKFTVFALFYSVFEGNFQVQAPPPGGLYLEGLFSEFYRTLGYLYPLSPKSDQYHFSSTCNNINT